nr:KilA-N domain-containing protein [Colletotrichum truncatum]KAF6799330.1 KilA-N domain-containing protein [Colletotrichum truncatum]
MSQNDFKTVFTPLPRLKGYDFEIFLETDVPRPADPIAAEEWRKNRNVTNGLLMNASESVLDRLCTAGWVDDGNPYELWQALEKHIPRISQDATAALVDEFAKTTANDHKTLHDALNRCHHLRKRIETIHGRLPDSFLAVFLLNFFKDRLPDTYKHFTSKGATHPTWNEVADTIYTLAQDEDQKRSYATIRNTPGGKSAGSRGPASPAVTTTVTSTVTASKEKKKCDHCNCDHETTKCYVAHPNLIPLHYVNRDKLIEKARKHVCGDRCRWYQPTSVDGTRQTVVRASPAILDKYSGYHWVVFLPNHKFATILAAIKKWDTEFYSLTGLKPKVWVSDNAPELIKVFNDPYFEGTRHNTTIAYTPSMNGTIERAGRTIVEGARTQLIDMSLPEELWDYSIDSVTQILNLLPTPSKGNLSPHEIMARELNLAAEHIIIQYTIRQKPIEGEKPVTGDPKPDETIVEKAMAPTDTHLMSPPPENLLETTATPRDSITNELNDDEFVASVETMETDHQDPDSLSTIVEEATSQPAESSRPRRASAQRPPGHYRAASGVRSYAKKTFLSADILASLTSRQFSLSVLSATALSKVLPDGVVIPKSYREAQKSLQWP